MLHFSSDFPTIPIISIDLVLVCLSKIRAYLDDPIGCNASSALFILEPPLLPLPVE